MLCPPASGRPGTSPKVRTLPPTRVATLEHQHPEARVLESQGRVQAGETGAHHDHVGGVGGGPGRMARQRG